MRRQKLVTARKKASKSQDDVANEIGADRTTVGMWERGESTPHPRLRKSYAGAIGITLEELDVILTGLPPLNGTSVGLSQYLGMEQSATYIATHEPHVVYGLLQTPGYAAAIARSVGVGETPPTYVERNISQRSHRQARVHEGAVSLHVVQPEIALRLQLGDAATMATQMAQLAEMGQRDNITLQIIPFSRGQYEALRVGGISIMHHPWAEGASVYFKRYEGIQLVEDMDEAAHFMASFNHAVNMALPPDESLEFITQVGEQWGA